MKRMYKTGLTALAAGLMLFAAVPSFAGPTDEQVLVDQAQITFREFQAAPEMQWFRDALKDAKGVLIVPDMFKAGLMFGGSGGKGVYLAKDAKTGEWSAPAFYNMGAFTFGLQIGGQAAEVIILAMTDEAARAMNSGQFKLGGDVSVAAGPVGAGTGGSAAVPTAAFVSFARAKGAYAGLILEGTVMTVDDESNKVYYGSSVEPSTIFSGDVGRDRAIEFRKAVGSAAKCC